MSNLLKNFILALCIIALLGAGYFFIKSKSDGEILDDTALDSMSSGDASDVSLRTEKILSDTQKINTYSLKWESIFSDRRFNSLKYYRKDIDDVKTGRENPFQPANY